MVACAARGSSQKAGAVDSASSAAISRYLLVRSKPHRKVVDRLAHLVQLSNQFFHDTFSVLVDLSWFGMNIITDDNVPYAVESALRLKPGAHIRYGRLL